MSGVGRLLVLAGAVGVAVAAVLPWVTVQLRPFDLELLGTDISAGEDTVSGMDTALGPILLAGAALVAALAVFDRARKLLIVLGTVIVVAGAGLIFYAMNVIEAETSGRSGLAQTLVDAAVAASAGPGPFVLLGSGVCIVLGALSRRHPRAGRRRDDRRAQAGIDRYGRAGFQGPAPRPPR